ncbi:hypothetical protein B0H65DRAFT_424328 [Neurospora tetraspora]|uniref:Uncharacterized protein n=1 Tax=Neurospora tetraspora TaxID=94610 RepID=A0AAE0JI33_9PEZI|nr:hypothetical protein B0H65DRAFT_424328 [Neurospora tetraspora]
MDIERCQLSQSDNAGGSSSPGSSYSTSPEPSHPSSSPTSSTTKKTLLHARRPSLLSSAISKQECTTINIAEDKDGPPELISYLSSSQGFAWNPEIFLPSYVDYDYIPLENRRDPIHEIILTDEEIKKILPQ